MFNFKMLVSGIISFIRYMALIIWRLAKGAGKIKPVPDDRKWWQKPGISVMYQIENRPGWDWDRDYRDFNKSLMDGNGDIKFNGPYCNIKEWVDLSMEAGLDYHVFEVKWHDGICYFNTNTTEWKAEKDYTKEFSDLSRRADIPFMFYYSAIFDHNPQFDHIQPDAGATPSLIGNKSEYINYIKKHYTELAEQYHPDGMWVDWFWADKSTENTIKYFREKYPDITLTFNFSNLQPKAFKKIDFTSSETHCYDGPWVVLRKEDSLLLPVFTSARKWNNVFRALFDHPWEVIACAGKFFQDPGLRDDPNDLIRTVAHTLACGGKFCICVTSQMDGHIFPDQVKQLRMIGSWYKPRKEYFINGGSIKYRWLHRMIKPMGVMVESDKPVSFLFLYRLFQPFGIEVQGHSFDIVVSLYGDGYLIHIFNRNNIRGFNRKGKIEGISVSLKGKVWRDMKTAVIVPQHRALNLKQKGSKKYFTINPEDIDPVSTIVYLPRCK